MSRCIRKDLILPNMKGKRSTDAIRELASLLEETSEIADPKSFLSDLFQREQKMTTGIGLGIAIPHVHANYIRSLLVGIGISHEGIDFKALDNQLVHIIVMIASPERHIDQYMQLLAAFSRFLQQENVREQLKQAQTESEVVEIFKVESSR